MISTVAVNHCLFKESIDIFFLYLRLLEKKVSSVVKYIAVGKEGLAFDYRAGQIGPKVANGSPSL